MSVPARSTAHRDLIHAKLALAGLESVRVGSQPAAALSPVPTTPVAAPVRGHHVPTVQELLDRPEAEFEWVLPDLMERGDRLLITAPEGVGKSTLLRQTAVQAAAGIVPFTADAPMAPVRVLLVDVENSDRQVARAMRALVAKARTLRPEFDPELLRVEIPPDGLDITKPADVAWLEDAILDARPDLVLIGPVYLLASGNPIEEVAMRPVVAAVDRLRREHGFAVVLETHSSKTVVTGGRRSIEPYGWSGWLRWPEFGYCIEPVSPKDPADPNYRWAPWRRPRDERAWPDMLHRGGPWPWMGAGGPAGAVPAPTVDTDVPDFREAVSAVVERQAGITTREAVASVGRRKADVLAVLESLAAGGYVKCSPGARGAVHWQSVRPFRLGLIDTEPPRS